ncbi:MAG: hypothetical protein BroJett025_03510 [Patescibacteria group bacterium]|nr:MAG: hypothetical protein BroJett025_03510 [Patescibacteria group bacterium]
MQTLKTDLLVYVFNVIEDEWSFVSSITDPIKRFGYISESEDAADAYFLSQATEKEFVYISPKPIPEEFVEYAKQNFNFSNAEVLVPSMRSHLICEDLVDDSRTFMSLVSKAKQYSRVVLTSYSASHQLYDLKESLEKLGISVYLPEAPDLEEVWTVNFFGSKSGIRQLAQKSQTKEPDFVMPEGIICVGREDAAKIAASKYIKQKGVVIKTNKGSGGSGVLIFREGELPTEYEACEKIILEQMSEDRYWDQFPIVIEDLISINHAVASGFPNVEFKIHKNGRIEMLYVCACQVTPKGKFFGIDINEDIINDRLQTKLEDTGYFIAEQYRAAGYRGHFDIDLMMAKSGVLYVCESNTRNTGGTDTYKIVRRLIGKEFMDEVYSMSRSRPEWFAKNGQTFAQVIEKLKPILFDKKKKTGVIINSHNSIPDGKLIYTIIEKDKKKAYQMEKNLILLLGDLKNLGPEFSV